MSPNVATRNEYWDASEGRQQTGIHLAGSQLPGIWRGELDMPVSQQLRARGPAGGEIGPQRGLVCGRSAGLGRADLDPGGTRAEARDERGRVLISGLAADRRGGHHQAGAERAGRPGPEQEPAGRDALRLQRGTHAGIARNHRVAAHLARDPGRGPGPYGRPGSQGGHRSTACGIGAACGRIAGDRRSRGRRGGAGDEARELNGA